MLSWLLSGTISGCGSFVCVIGQYGRVVSSFNIKGLILQYDYENNIIDCIIYCLGLQCVG